MNALLQIFVLTTTIAAALCVVPRAEQVETVKANVRLVLKMHKLYKEGLVTEDVVQDACTVAGPALTACSALIPAANVACGAADLACTGYSVGKTLVHAISSLFG